MRSLIINSKEIFFDQIKSKNYPLGLTDYEKRTLDFCSDFLNGEEIFHLKTSGSTGEPKTIIVEASKMKLSAGMTAKALGLKENYQSLVCLNTDFIAGKMMLVRGIQSGMKLFIIDPSSNPLLNIHSDTRFDFTALVPLQIETILNDTPEKKVILDNMNAIIIGGAAINAGLEELLQSVKAPVYHTFGMTETLSHIALRKINGEDKQDYFEILDNVSIKTDDRNCLVIESPFSQKPLITNDVVELLDDKKFRWLGRNDFIINSGGIKIHPEKLEKEIEKIFYHFNLSNKFFISSTPDNYLGHAVILIIEGEEIKENDLKKLQIEISNRLSKYEIPKKIFFVKKFIETGSGKIDRKKTKEIIT